MSVFIIIVFAIILLYYLQDYPLWKKNSKGKHNVTYSKNGMLATYTYEIPYPKDDIIQRLCRKREDDKLYYTFNQDTLEITFSNPDSGFRNVNVPGILYQLEMEETNQSTTLRVKQKTLGLSNSTNRVAFLMNSFWTEKLL